MRKIFKVRDELFGANVWK